MNLHCSWLQNLFGESFHEWKVIPSMLIAKYFEKSFDIYSGLYFDWKLLVKFIETIFFNGVALFFFLNYLLVFWQGFFDFIEERYILSCYFTHKVLTFVYP